MTQQQKTTLREVMSLAWQFVKLNGFGLSEALKTSWRNVKTRAAMHAGIARFTFRKVDGTIREAFGTLRADLVPSHTSGRTPNKTVQVYFDTEKAAWRCYKKANLLI